MSEAPLESPCASARAATSNKSSRRCSGSSRVAASRSSSRAAAGSPASSLSLESSCSAHARALGYAASRRSSAPRRTRSAAARSDAPRARSMASRSGDTSLGSSCQTFCSASRVVPRSPASRADSSYMRTRRGLVGKRSVAFARAARDTGFSSIARGCFGQVVAGLLQRLFALHAQGREAIQRLAAHLRIERGGDAGPALPAADRSGPDDRRGPPAA